MARNKVLLKIYPELNVGDDLFLSIILNRYPTTFFYLLASRKQYKKFSKRFQNLKIVDTLENITFLDRVCLKLSRLLPVSLQKRVYRNHLRKQYGETLNICDTFVTIGGSMFIENKVDQLQRNVLFYQLINKYFENKSKLFIGCNFGPYYTPEFLVDFKNIFQEAADLSFREEKSKKVLNLENIRVNPDIVFSLKFNEAATKIVGSVGMVLVDPRLKMANSNIDYKLYLEAFRGIIKFYSDRNREVCLFSFCKKENDEGLIADILDDNSFGDARVSVKHYDGDVNLFLQEYSKMESVYCGRFHSMILSMLFNQKILPLIYSSKMSNILGDVNFSGSVVDLTALKPSDCEQYDQYLNNNKYNSQVVSEESEKHFNKLDQILQRCFPL